MKAKAYLLEITNDLILFSIKAIIVLFIAFTFLQSYLPSNQLALIPGYVSDLGAFLNRTHIKKQLIGSIASSYAINEKIKELEISGDAEMITFAKEHKKSLSSKCN